MHRLARRVDRRRGLQPLDRGTGGPIERHVEFLLDLRLEVGLDLID